MRDLALRLLVAVWFLAYMAAVYLALHALAARLSRRPDSRVLWFFSVVTTPLTRPVAALLPKGTSEARIRLVTLGLVLVVWLAARLLMARLRP
jgi:hypothetical protein